MSLEQTEKECAENAVAPRVSLDDIKAAINHVHYVNAEDAIGPVGARGPHLNTLTLCLIEMKNGFVIVGKSAPASPENFNPQLGEKLAYEDAVRQIWPLMGFALREKLAGT